MYQVILLDDEKIVRLALKTMIHWESYGFTVSGSFSSAVAALKAISENTPDLIITDIAMPNVDGLRFIEQVRLLQLDCPIVVLTNHENFSYAVNAIRYSVMDYVIKSDISPETLTSLVLKAKNLLDSRSHFDIVTPLSHGQADYGLLFRALNGEQVSDHLSDAYCFCLAFLDPSHGIEEGAGSGFHNLLCENLNRPAESLLQCNGTQSIILLHQAEREAFLADAPMQCGRIGEFSHAYLNRTCGFVLSDSFVEPAAFCSELDTCRQAVPYAVFCGPSEMILLSDFRRLSPDPVPVKAVCEHILQALSSGQEELVKDEFNTFLECSAMHGAAMGPASHALSSICLCVLLENSAMMLHEERCAAWDNLRASVRRADYVAFFLRQVALATRQKQYIESISRKQDIKQIIAVIHENLFQHISLAMLSHSVHMTENYISRLFKSETGVNVVNYINLAKMEQARLMFSNPQNTVRMVAAELGFTESSYFIKLFRRTYGLGPSEYKKFVRDRDADALLKCTN